MGTLAFTKMHALGNDFLVVNGMSQQFTVDTAWIERMSDRHCGIGFDQLLVVTPATHDATDFDLMIYNSDGSSAKQCGNGTLCVARYAREEGLTQKDELSFRTLGGCVTARLSRSPGNQDLEVSAALGVPDAEPANVPFMAKARSLSYELDVGVEAPVQLIPIGMGNPHAVVFCHDLCDTEMERLANAIQRHARFPSSVNVEFVAIETRARLRMRVFERGAGETMACGTGSCAAVAAARLANRVDNRVAVVQDGGTAWVEWEGVGHQISLTAIASRVFDGVVPLG